MIDRELSKNSIIFSRNITLFWNQIRDNQLWPSTQDCIFLHHNKAKLIMGEFHRMAKRVATATWWRRLINRGFLTIFFSIILFQDFDYWSINTGWPLKRGSTVFSNKLLKTCCCLFLLLTKDKTEMIGKMNGCKCSCRCNSIRTGSVVRLTCGVGGTVGAGFWRRFMTLNSNPNRPGPDEAACGGIPGRPPWFWPAEWLPKCCCFKRSLLWAFTNFMSWKIKEILPNNPRHILYKLLMLSYTLHSPI